MRSRAALLACLAALAGVAAAPSTRGAAPTVPARAEETAMLGGGPSRNAVVAAISLPAAFDIESGDGVLWRAEA